MKLKYILLSAVFMSEKKIAFQSKNITIWKDKEMKFGIRPVEKIVNLNKADRAN
jgi:hypothetical protein